MQQHTTHDSCCLSWCSCFILQAAGTIHTDFEKGFICAEVMHYDELHELGTEHAVKAAGKYRQEGKNYTVADGDIIYFKAGRIQK